MKKFPRILFFISGSLPTEEQFVSAESYGPNVSFRNGLLVPADGTLEVCDGVAGSVPDRYADAYPSAEEAIKAYKEAREARLAAVGDTLPAKPVDPSSEDNKTPPAPAKPASEDKPKQAKAAVGWTANPVVNS